jgi:hypothetical protein
VLSREREWWGLCGGGVGGNGEGTVNEVWEFHGC